MSNITNPTGAAKNLDFNTFERLAKDSQVDNKATVHLATQTGGRVVVGLEAKTPIAGKKINLLGKPIKDLGKATEAQRNGILATQAFKQALIQRYGETIANALDKHLLQSGQAKILTAEDLRKNLKVADAIVRILRATPTAPNDAPDVRPNHNHELSNSSSRRNDDGSPLEPSAPSRSRSASVSSERSVDAYFRNREQPPVYRSTEELQPSAPPLANPKEVAEIDEAGNQWHHNPLFVKPDEALDLAGESASLPEDPEAARAAQRPRAKALSQAELEASFDEALNLLNEKTNNSGKI
jgi:hypothetical protein